MPRNCLGCTARAAVQLEPIGRARPAAVSVDGSFSWHIWESALAMPLAVLASSVPLAAITADHHHSRFHGGGAHAAGAAAAAGAGVGGAASCVCVPTSNALHPVILCRFIDGRRAQLERQQQELAEQRRAGGSGGMPTRQQDLLVLQASCVRSVVMLLACSDVCVSSFGCWAGGGSTGDPVNQHLSPPTGQRGVPRVTCVFITTIAGCSMPSVLDVLSGVTACRSARCATPPWRSAAPAGGRAGSRASRTSGAALVELVGKLPSRGAGVICCCSSSQVSQPLPRSASTIQNKC